mgnify:CR=1 FL=1
MSIDIIIADDHAILRSGIRKVLEFEDDFKVVAEATNGLEAIQKTLELEPDILLLDINMPIKNGFETVRELSAQKTETKIIILTINDDENYVLEMLKNGASGYLLKDIEPSMLVQAIRMINQGESYIYPDIARKIFGDVGFSGDIVKAAEVMLKERRCEKLTARELDVLQCICKGMSNQEIAKDLFVSEKTVKNHLTNIFRKINVNDRTQALLYVLKNKIMTID